MNIRKMYVVPSEFFDSLMRKSRITENPLIGAQAQVELEKEKIVNSHAKTENDMKKYINATHMQSVLEEQRKIEASEPIKVQVMPPCSPSTNQY